MMSVKLDTLLRHYATITKRASETMDAMTDSLKEMSYDFRDGFAIGAEGITALFGTVDMVIKDLTYLKNMMTHDLKEE